MSLISRLLHAVQSWRRRPAGHKTTKRAAVDMERLDHRQLLSVNFTGNVATDFPVTQQPGVVALGTPPGWTPAAIPPALQQINPATGVAYVPVSGFTINGIRVSYDPTQDILSIGLEQPNSGLPTQPGPVIAGDSDANGNDGTVDPATQAIEPNLQDFPDFGGSEFMGAFLDLRGTGYADVVAGYSGTDPRSPKQYQVSQAVVNTNAPPAIPGFGTILPQFIGNVYKVNSPVHPNLEFNIDHFSQLYLQETGHALTPDSIINIGAMGGSADDDGIGEEFNAEQPFVLKNATVPPVVCPPPPPVSPPVLINPHLNRHMNTAHPTDIRVTVFGTSGFDVTQINPATVTFGGAHPIFSYERFVNRDNFLDETFVFKGTDVNLPGGIIDAPITGTLKNGQTFSSSARVFNRTDAFYSPSAVSGAQARQAANPGNLAVPLSTLQMKVAQTGDIPVVTGPTAAAVSTTAVQVPVAMPQDITAQGGPTRRHHQAHSGGHHGGRISPKLKASMNAYLNSQSGSLSASAS